MKWLLIFVLFSLALPPQAEEWTPPVIVKKGKLKAASYRARLAGDVLLIEVTHKPGWHIYALDNKARAKKKAGTPPLGIEEGHAHRSQRRVASRRQVAAVRAERSVADRDQLVHLGL